MVIQTGRQTHTQPVINMHRFSSPRCRSVGRLVRLQENGRYTRGLINVFEPSSWQSRGCERGEGSWCNANTPKSVNSSHMPTPLCVFVYSHEHEEASALMLGNAYFSPGRLHPTSRPSSTEGLVLVRSFLRWSACTIRRSRSIQCICKCSSSSPDGRCAQRTSLFNTSSRAVHAREHRDSRPTQPQTC